MSEGSGVDSSGGADLRRSVRLRMELRWRDIDSLGHLTHSVYHDFLAEARVAVLSSDAGTAHRRFVLAHVELDHRREVRHEDGHVEVVARIESLGTSSVKIAHEVLLTDGTVAADGSSVLVAWDGERRTSRPLDDRERQLLSEP
ncbi:MAG: acyl-CoA thioesterase [Solirubrobacteraceae bacterium]